MTFPTSTSPWNEDDESSGSSTFYFDNYTTPLVDNFSDYHFDHYRCEKFEEKIANLSDTFHKYPTYLRPLVLSMYVCVTCFGALGNALVVAAVVRNAQMRTPRNYFIINLALSDFLLCTITVPFTMIMTFNTFWTLGEFTCKLVSTSQGVNTFVSTMSITAIGLDRYWVILFPTRTNQQRIVVAICFIAIWTLSIIFALPLYSATTLNKLPMCDYVLIVCAEQWDQMPFKQNVYSISCFVFQYLLPIMMLTFLYGRIVWRLKGRMMFNRQSSHQDDTRRRSVESRQRRMNILLACIVLIFAVSWLPLNIYNVLVAFGSPYEVLAFQCCHILGMTSACANPILYGVFNDNFRNEFQSIFTALKVIPLLHAIRRYLRRTLGLSEGDSPSGSVAPNKRSRTFITNAPPTNCNAKPEETRLMPTLVTLSPGRQANGETTTIIANAHSDLVDHHLDMVDRHSDMADRHSDMVDHHNLDRVDEPLLDTTVVSANLEETIPLCRRNLLMNGLNSKNYLLKTDLV